MRLLIICTILFLFSGCLFKSNVISLTPYRPNSTSSSAQLSIQKAYIKSVVDNRSNEKVIGKVKTLDSIHPLYSKTNIKLWLYDALEKEFSAHDHVIIHKPLREAAKLHITITDMQVVYDESLKNYSNLEGYIKFELTIDKGWRLKRTTNMSRKKTTHFVAPPNQWELEDFVRSLLDDTVRDIVQKSIKF